MATPGRKPVTIDGGKTLPGINLSASAISLEFGLATATVKKRLIDAGLQETGKNRGNPIYRLKDVIKILLNPDGETDPNTLGPQERKAWYQSEKDRIIVEEKQGELIPVDQHRDALADVIKITVQTLDLLPDILERDCDLTPTQIEKMIELTDQVRNHWADQIES